MKKVDFLQMLVDENNDNDPVTQKLYSDVIDCLDLGLSQVPDNYEITDTTVGLKELLDMVEKKAKESSAHCVGPFEAAEMFAARFGVTYSRLSKRGSAASGLVRLEDFL